MSDIVSNLGLQVHCYEASPGVDINEIPRPLPMEDPGSLINVEKLQDKANKLQKAQLSWKKVIQEHVSKGIWDDGLLVANCSKSEFDEQSKAVFRTAVRERISAPLAQNRTHVVIVGIHRGIIEELFGEGQASPDRKGVLEQSLDQTGFNSVVSELRSMLQGMISAAEIKELADRCSALAEVVEDAPGVEVPEDIRAKASILAKKRTSSTELRKELQGIIEEEARAVDGTAWADALADRLIEVMPAFAETFRGLTHTKLIKQQHAQTVLADCIVLSTAEGALFQSDNVMSKAAFNLCRPVFKMESLWAVKFKGPIENALKRAQEALARFCREKLNPDADSDVVADAVANALSTTFNAPARLNQIRERFLNCTKHFITKPKAFFTNDPIHSLPQFALEQLFVLALEPYGPNKRDVFLRGNRPGKETRDELSDRFSTESLHKYKVELVARISEEIQALWDTIRNETMTIFETVGKRGRVNGAKTTKFIKTTLTFVGTADKMVDVTLQTTGTSAVPQFKEAAAAIGAISVELASMELTGVATDNAVVRTMAAKAALDNFQATTNLPDCLENNDFKEPINRSSASGWRWQEGHKNVIAWGSSLLPDIWPALCKQTPGSAGPAEGRIAGALPAALGALLLERSAKLMPASLDCQGRLRLFNLLRYAVDSRQDKAAAQELLRCLDLQVASMASTERAAAAAADNLLRAYLARFASQFHTRIELFIMGSEPGEVCEVTTMPDKTKGSAALRFSIRLLWDSATNAPYLIHISKKKKRAQTPDLEEVREYEQSEQEKQEKRAASNVMNSKVTENYMAQKESQASGGMRERPKGQYSKAERASASMQANAAYGLKRSRPQLGSPTSSPHSSAAGGKSRKTQPRAWNGWIESMSRTTGKPYWTREKDGKSTYDKPDGFPSPAKSPVSSPREKTSSIPTRKWKQWREYKSKTTGKYYYRKDGSSQSVSTPPPGFPRRQSASRSPEAEMEEEADDILTSARGSA